MAVSLVICMVVVPAPAAAALVAAVCVVVVWVVLVTVAVVTVVVVVAVVGVVVSVAVVFVAVVVVPVAVAASTEGGTQKSRPSLWKRVHTSQLFQCSSCLSALSVALTWELSPWSSEVKLSPSGTILDSSPASKKSMSPSMSKKSPPGLALTVQRPSKRPAARGTQTSPLPQCRLMPTRLATESGASGSAVVNLSSLTVVISDSVPPTTLSMSPLMWKIFFPGSSRGVHLPSKGPLVGIQTSPLLQTILPSESSPASWGCHPWRPVVNLSFPCGNRPNSMSSTKWSVEPWITKTSAPGSLSWVHRPSKGPIMWASRMNACSAPLLSELASTSMPLTLTYWPEGAFR
mmetsp:Transcript_177823/g.432672  ORF Transcript_177823/g.432672 Transcript_177823/m.432672 type:complete len:346 (+) Transcript_177823:1371-2408(+)